MNKKGFTLVEILAVIVIISVVALIGTASLTAVRKNMNQNMFETKLELVLSAAKSYADDNKSSITSTKNVTIQSLINSGYLATDETDTDNKPAILHFSSNESLNNMNIQVQIVHNRARACINDSDTTVKNNLLTDGLTKSSFNKQTLFC